MRLVGELVSVPDEIFSIFPHHKYSYLKFFNLETFLFSQILMFFNNAINPYIYDSDKKHTFKIILTILYYLLAG